MKSFSSMQCPSCSHKLSRVTNKRNSPSLIRRRRECMKCKHRWTTHEHNANACLFGKKQAPTTVVLPKLDRSRDWVREISKKIGW